jgi:TonB family protein
MFSMLPHRPAPWREFVFSMATEALLLLAIFSVGLLYPAILVLPSHDYHFVNLVSDPVPVPQQPAPVRLLKTTPLEVPTTALRVPPSVVKPKAQQNSPTAPKMQVAENKPVDLPPAKPVIPRELVKTNVFSTGSSAPPTIAQAPQRVQTGGFGDPNGVPARATNGHPVNIAALGSFDLPSGPGHGNGTGGSRGVRGVVASAGFGNGVATGDGSGSINTTRGTGKAAVGPSGFGDVEAAAPSKQSPEQTKAPRVVAAEITYKPTPVYTAEARQLRIEGEVLLEVVFESSGKIRVLRVIRGLGHGLDEAAVRAAEQIRFKPALREGQPTDSTAVLHILFQLA